MFKIFKKPAEYTDGFINKDNKNIKEIYAKLCKIFPNSKIFFKLERSYDYKIDRKYIGLYIDGRCMSVQSLETFNWNTSWVCILGKLDMMKLELDNTGLFAGSCFIEE